ncbi:MAG: energy transducer TonB [Flavobacteriaceae bacterium]|nr:energy transducer TonB [Flavobacteriaceae bacterium]
MLVKKYKKARLTPYSKLFFQLGLILTLIIIYIALEWKSFDRGINELGQTIFQIEEVEEIPITERIIEVKPPPPPPPAPQIIEIVSDELEIIETILESTETDEGEAIKIDYSIDDIDEIIEDEIVDMEVPFAIIEEPPVYPGCTGTKAQKKKCMVAKITKLVSRKYNTGLAGDLGLSPGKKRVYVQFKIDKTGKVVNVRARGPHKRLEKEAIRVVNMIPKMTPGKQRGRPVGVKYTLPITLIVE